MLNVVALMGRLVADPELKHTQNGIAVCGFRVAVDRNFPDRDGNRQADFIGIVAWRQTAEFVCKYFSKGQMIALRGSIQARNYEDKNGSKRTAVEVVADQVSFCGKKESDPGGRDSRYRDAPPEKGYNYPAPAAASWGQPVERGGPDGVEDDPQQYFDGDVDLPF